MHWERLSLASQNVVDFVCHLRIAKIYTLTMWMKTIYANENYICERKQDMRIKTIYVNEKHIYGNESLIIIFEWKWYYYFFYRF